MARFNDYILNVGESAAKRLAILHQAYAPSSIRFLTELGIRPGMQIADVGCGSGNMSLWLAQQVGPEGKVLAMDASAEQVAVVKRRFAEANLQQGEFQVCDVMELPRLQQKFDLIYGRFVLAFLKQPKIGLETLSACLKPGGVLACEEIDCRSWYGYPLNEAYEKHITVFMKLGEGLGGDFRIGPKLYGYFQDVGFASPQVSIAQPVFKGFEQKQHMELVTRECAQRYLDAGLLTEQELEKLLRELHQLALDDRFLMAGAQVFQVAGKVGGWA